jgi:hypothetical protein
VFIGADFVDKVLQIMYYNLVDVYIHRLKEGKNMLDILKCTLGGADLSSNDLIVIPTLTSTIVTIVQWVIPVILIVLGMIDLGKAVTSNDEKQMKEAQKTLIKRVIYAVLVLFIVAIVRFVFSALAPDDNSKKSVSGCINCFINKQDC